MRRLLLIIVLTVATPCMHAQRMLSSSPRFVSGLNRGGHSRSFFYPLAFSDPFYSDYLSSTGYPVASEPPVIILQAPPAAAPVPDRSPSPPLMIELQGDRYVRVSGPETSGAELIAPDIVDRPTIDRMPDSPHRPQRPSGAAIHAVAVPDLPPAVLVFRDGHREEASDYTIADGILYARGDYTTGSWNRKIELSSLNLPETIASNTSRGVRFQLPSSPNEVIVRP
jgi:hypothetical protein